MDKPELKISVFSDYICPFCYIGSRRVLRLNDTYDVKINWCGLEIHPDTPATGMPVSKLGYAPEQWQAMMATLTAMAAEEGLSLKTHDFTTNSRRALLLAEAAKAAGRERFYAVHERLFSAYFSDGLNIGDADVLRELAAECGLESERVEAAWTDPRYGQRLDINLRHAVELEVRGTPTYVFGTRLLVGAVPETELRQAAAELLAAQ